MADAEPDPRSVPKPVPSQETQREVAALLAMLGLPPPEPEPTDRAPPAPKAPDENNSPIPSSRTNPEEERL